ncbi:HEAT repeat domain-containing protein [Thalassoglobus polymorphus]|uniref:HEAT repeat protein n=1 Tax=Thalassoglobus polymorphus TaxID=2527994 RepID=A0A517QLF7_9PLAN|nr:HEAT repeat domain-containing protein [Thalassoglobus polymorphus]QDT32472.1 HEAT repeat protein [Thalassoglobus polymorphus]
MRQLIQQLTLSHFSLLLTFCFAFLSGCGGADQSAPPASPAKATGITEAKNAPPAPLPSASSIATQETASSDNKNSNSKTMLAQPETPARAPLKLPSTKEKKTVEVERASVPVLTAASAPTQKVEFDNNLVDAFEKLVTPANSIEAWEQAHQAVLDLGEEVVPLLADRLKNGNNIERETAASTLISFGPDAEGAIPELRSALKDPVPFVRANAAITLVQFPKEAPQAVSVLVTLLEHDDPTLQQMAAMNLSVLGEDASSHVDDLTRILDTTEGPELLLPVVELLGRIGPAAETAVPKLKQIAFEQKGEVGAAANSAIQLIQTESQE